ncbi:MAG: quinolinate synthase NadA [Lachnospiraceae bacterium]|nr:quinolinate synthase NadA [Lachnospiraceae bacterium]MEE0919454.1 quinolinate synthase NadA [Lachnospiraceae bacterium]
MEDKILREKIEALKKQKNAVIMAHYYVEDDVQELADYIGDSYYLSDMATRIDADIIVLCGVKFMGESAKVLNPDKKVLLPAADADCPMAHMAEIDKINEVRKQYDDVAVVCYVNSTAELKAASDVCVTSANALKIVKELPNKNIFFIPDQNLAHYIADKLPEKNFIFNDGFCHVHHTITTEQIKAAKQARPDALVLVHPECKPEVTAMADYVGSTSGIIKFATESDAKEFIVSTEMGVMYELKKRNPDKKFYTAGNMQVCPNMKKITMEKILHVLETEQSEVIMDKSLMDAAHLPMIRMLELAAK